MKKGRDPYSHAPLFRKLPEVFLAELLRVGSVLGRVAGRIHSVTSVQRGVHGVLRSVHGVVRDVGGVRHVVGSFLLGAGGQAERCSDNERKSDSFGHG